MRFDETQRRELGKALFDIGKLSFAITVATPLVAAGVQAWGAAVGGGIFVMSVFVVATMLVREEQR